MQETKFIWMNGALVAWAEAKVHALTHSLHYGGGAFEGIRVYKTDKGPAIFRAKEHFERLLYSAGAISISIPYSADQLVEATASLIRENNLEQGYIRPLAYYGYGVMGLNPRGAPSDVLIACWPWAKYLPNELVNIKVSKYIRIHPKSTVADAKICGHYVNSMLSALEVRGTKYDEALFLDYEGNIAEGPGENFFIIKNNELITPKLGNILAGITRNSIIQIAESEGIRVTERVLTIDEAMEADEAFFTGTAAEVTLIGSINDQPVGSGSAGPISSRLKELYLDTVYGRNKKFSHFLHYV